jgi:hypothetical protein
MKTEIMAVASIAAGVVLGLLVYWSLLQAPKS